MKENIDCIIIDDEPKAREVLKRYISQVDFLILHEEFKNPMDALGYLRQNKIDLIFLDINMPTMSGIEFINSLADKPQIIFSTAYSEYALEGYENDVIDYLLKPIRLERFIKAINKIRTQAETNTQPNHIVVKSGHRYHRVKLDEILYFEKEGNYLEIFLKDGHKILLRENMSSLFNLIPESKFIRIHKSYVVSKKSIKAAEANKVILLNNTRIPLGASYREALMEYFTAS